MFLEFTQVWILIQTYFFHSQSCIKGFWGFGVVGVDGVVWVVGVDGKVVVVRVVGRNC